MNESHNFKWKQHKHNWTEVKEYVYQKYYQRKKKGAAKRFFWITKKANREDRISIANIEQKSHGFKQNIKT